MREVTFFVTLSDTLNLNALRDAWNVQAQLTPGLPRVEFKALQGTSLEAVAYSTPPDWAGEFRRLLGRVVLQVNEFCAIRDMYHVGVKTYAVIYLDQAATRSELEQQYARERLPGDPQLVFHEITPIKFRVNLHPAHTAPIDQAELEKLLRLRLHCRTDEPAGGNVRDETGQTSFLL